MKFSDFPISTLVSNLEASCQRLGSRPRIRMLLFVAACSSSADGGVGRVIKRRKKDSRLHTLHSRTPPRDSRPPANRRGALLCSALLSSVPPNGLNSRLTLSTCAFNLSPFDLCLARLFERYRRSCLTALVIKPVETSLFNV